MEWNEAVVAGSFRGLRGGAFSLFGFDLHASFRTGYNATGESDGFGFRVAEVAEVPCEFDADRDGDVDLYDVALMQRAFTGPR